MKKARFERITLEKVVNGGQTIATADDGRKLFVWGGLPSEDVTVRVTKRKSKLLEGIVTEVHNASPERIAPADPDSYLSTSPWQIMTFEAEQRYKAQLIDDAFRQHHVSLPSETAIYTDSVDAHYRNKVEFSWYGDNSETGEDRLHLAFFRRGSKGKVIVDSSALLPVSMIQLAQQIRDNLQADHVTARQLKTLLIRCDSSRRCVWQLYAKDADFDASNLIVQMTKLAENNASLQGGEVIYSDPRSPASVITKRLASHGHVTLNDTVLGVPFRYAAESFFQINLPVYEQALRDMSSWVPKSGQTVDMYSGVGSIGLTIGNQQTTLVEVNQYAVSEMKRNIQELGISATPVLAASEAALDYIVADKTIILDPPRAGLHADVVNRLLQVKPPRIIYLSCNPSTQARDIALLLEKYDIVHHHGYNFFPRTPHIEHLVVLDAK